MSIIRIKKEKEYFSIQNKIVRDSQLNDEAFRLYCYLMSNVDEWKIYNNDLKKKLNWTSHKLNKALKNLKENKFIERERKHENGRYRWETTVYEEPITIPRKTTHCNSMNCKTSDIRKTNVNKTKLKNIKKENFDFDSYVSNLSTEYSNSIYELIIDFLNKKIHRSQRSIDENLKILKNKTVEEQETILINAIKGGYPALKELTGTNYQKGIKNAPELKAKGKDKIVDLFLSREYAHKSLEEIKAIINNDLLIQNKSEKIINIYFTPEFINELQRYHQLSISDIAELINYSEYEVNTIISKKY